MAKRIQKLTMENFRGSTNYIEIPFDIQKPIAMIFGENGTGKSAIVDAIEFICNNGLGSLNDRSCGTKINKVPTIGKGKDDVKVTLAFDNKNWNATIVSTEPETTPAGIPTATVLRRSKLLDLVNAKPRDRYQALSQFISLPQIEKCENTLRDEIRTVTSSYNSSTQAAAQAHEDLQQLWDAVERPGHDYYSWAKLKTDKDIKTLQTELTENNTKIATISGSINSITTAQNSLNDSKERLEQAKNEYGQAVELYETSEQEFQEAQKKVSNSSGALIDTLKDALKYLQENPSIVVCPVCERGDIESEDLQTRIKVRLDDMNDLVAKKTKAENDKRACESQETVLKTIQSDFDTKKDVLVTSMQNNMKENVTYLDTSLSNYVSLCMAIDGFSEETLLAATEYLGLLTKVKEALENQKNKAQKTIDQYHAIKGHLDSISQKESEARSFELILEKLNYFISILECERKQYITSIFTDISSNVESMYSKVHPEEGLKNIKLYIRPNVQGSVECDSEFQGHGGVPPQAYFSESHLDTLGICLFLALAKYFSDDNTIVVLDDVMTSVDQEHIDRFMRMLHEEATYFNQLILTTHYRPWRDRYRYARGPVSNIDLLELLPWSMPNGIRIDRTKLSLDELKSSIEGEPLDRQVVSSKAGILLENVLDHLALSYECKVPRLPSPQYTLGILFDGLTSKLKNALKIVKLKNDGTIDSEDNLETMLAPLSEITWIRNQVGCHFYLDDSTSNSEVKAFGESVLALCKTVICDECGEVPGRKKSGSYWECQCKKTQLHPLDMPQ